MANAHLSHDELIAWRDQGAGDRTWIVPHLAACAACREMAADVERNRPGDAVPLGFDAADFVSRGYRAGQPVATPRWPGAWRWLAAAAAVLAALAVVPTLLTRPDGDSEVTRGDGPAVVPTSPVDTTVSVDELAFEWQGAAPNGRVRLNVVDLDNPAEPLIEREVDGSQYVPTPEERRRFRPGQSVYWYLEVRGGSGGTSPAVQFRVR